MFSRKKKKKKTADLDFTWNSDKRSTFRIEPPAEQPLHLETANRSFPVLDISAGGISFLAPGGLVEKASVVFALQLPEEDEPVRVTVRIMYADAGKARGPFVNLDPLTRDKIHLYILNLQKEQAKIRRT